MIATFGAGCFWHVEEEFRKIKGVISTKVGYCGGKTKDPTYVSVCKKNTGHAESVQISYDPDIISYEKLLEIFWKIHDPTTPNRQGLDIGSQYRSVIFYHNMEQKAVAETSKKQAQERYREKIVTSIEPVQTFYLAEEYHQKYIKKKRGLNF